MNCRVCGSNDLSVFCDLGLQPQANNLVSEVGLDDPEIYYPLRPMYCKKCSLVQLPELVAPEPLFSDYPYFSSQSGMFVEHARRYAEDVIKRFKLDDESLVVEIASNDGYLLKNFARQGYRCYGVEPAKNVAERAIKQGIPTIIDFFSSKLVCDLLVESKDEWITDEKADLVIANNVLAHVPNLHDFLQGVRLLLKPEGVFTVEVPWLECLVNDCAIGQIYVEHHSYFLLRSLEHILGLTAIPLRVFDVERLDVHGGSMRVYICHRDAHHTDSVRVGTWRNHETRWISDGNIHSFRDSIPALKRSVWSLLTEVSGKSIVGYAAAAKATTMLEYCGVGSDMIPWIADTTDEKQGLYMPGSHIPIVDPQYLSDRNPEVVWVLASNILAEAIPKIHEACSDALIVSQEGAEIRAHVPA